MKLFNRLARGFLYAFQHAEKAVLSVATRFAMADPASVWTAGLSLTGSTLPGSARTGEYRVAGE